eukprot:TRINITY_DN728_c0_g3_i1.p1 TRINITY_DN728_c0_g3~~TRINITY_DN728_c0_g3_i1.p1  ORF type:complete len:169 (+),score=82.99 TRINITY_DN728_c0_g3_i1:133-639(+)
MSTPTSAQQSAHKIAVLGSQQSGKSRLITRLANDFWLDEFSGDVTEVEDTIPLDGRWVTFKFLNPQETTFETIPSNIYNGADYILIVFDSTNLSTLDQAFQLCLKINRQSILVGSKSDSLNCQITRDQLKSRIQSNSQISLLIIDFYLVSAKDDNDEGCTLLRKRLAL